MNTSLPFTKRTVFALLLVLGCGAARAEDMIKYVGRPGSEVKLDGTSNIHDWTVKGMVIAGSMEVSPAFDKDLKTLTPPPKVDVSIPVRSLKSGNGRMDEVMQEHMNMKQYSKIEYHLTAMTLKSEPKSPKSAAEYTSTGDLTISGIKKTIEMPVTIERMDDGKLKVKCAIPVKMTDFKISPPAPALAGGLIKTGDDVKVMIEWVLAKVESAQAAK